MEREVGDPDADGDRQALAAGQLEVAGLEPVPDAPGGRRQVPGNRGRSDRDELVGPEPGEQGPALRVRSERCRDGQERKVADRRPVDVIQQPEVVDVDERDADRAVVWSAPPRRAP